MKTYYVYILTNHNHRVLYIGVTNDLIRRVFEHREGVVEGFTKRYKVDTLVHYEEASDIHSAIAREKQLKNWQREWKVQLIEGKNPGWEDLYPYIVGQKETA